MCYLKKHWAPTTGALWAEARHGRIAELDGAWTTSLLRLHILVTINFTNLLMNKFESIVWNIFYVPGTIILWSTWNYQQPHGMLIFCNVVSIVGNWRRDYKRHFAHCDNCRHVGQLTYDLCLNDELQTKELGGSTSKTSFKIPLHGGFHEEKVGMWWKRKEPIFTECLLHVCHYARSSICIAFVYYS